MLAHGPPCSGQGKSDDIILNSIFLLIPFHTVALTVALMLALHLHAVALTVALMLALHLHAVAPQ